jgi:hypothetical protein
MAHELPRRVWLLWLQGWAVAPPLALAVAASWEANAGWEVVRLDASNVRDYIPLDDAPHLYDERRDIAHVDASDIIRMALLARHGGVWADATMLCMQPLDSWAPAAVAPGGFWAYTAPNGTPASWFMLAAPRNALVVAWKAACDAFWADADRARRRGAAKDPRASLTDTSFFTGGSVFGHWLDAQLRPMLHGGAPEAAGVRAVWAAAPVLPCDEFGSAHMFLGKYRGRWSHALEPAVEAALRDAPPFALKLWSTVHEAWPTLLADAGCAASNAGCALRYAHGQRCKAAPHAMTPRRG